MRQWTSTAEEVTESDLWFKELSDGCVEQKLECCKSRHKGTSCESISTVHEGDGISEYDVCRSEQQEWDLDIF